MNAYKFNGIAGHLARRAIIDGLHICNSDLYKILKSVNYFTGVITLKDNRQFKLTLEPFNNIYKYIEINENNFSSLHTKESGII